MPGTAAEAIRALGAGQAHLAEQRADTDRRGARRTATAGESLRTFAAAPRDRLGGLRMSSARPPLFTPTRTLAATTASPIHFPGPNLRSRLPHYAVATDCQPHQSCQP